MYENYSPTTQRVDPAMEHLHQDFYTIAKDCLLQACSRADNPIYRAPFDNRDIENCLQDFNNQFNGYFKHFISVSDSVKYGVRITDEELKDYAYNVIVPKCIGDYVLWLRQQHQQPPSQYQTVRQPSYGAPVGRAGYDYTQQSTRPASVYGAAPSASTKGFAALKGSGIIPKVTEQPQPQYQYQQQQQQPEYQQAPQRPVVTEAPYGVITSTTMKSKTIDPLEYKPNTVTVEPDAASPCIVTGCGYYTNKFVSIATQRVDIVPPWNSRQEAVDFAASMVTGFATPNMYCNTLTCKTLSVKKFEAGDLNNARATLTDVASMVRGLNSLSDITAILLPELNKLRPHVKTYIDKLIMDEVNIVLRTHLFKPNDPTKYPKIGTWEAIGKLFDSSLGGYIKFMNEQYKSDYESCIRYCIQAAILNILSPSGASPVITSSNQGVVAAARGLAVSINNKLPRDYGGMTEDELHQMSKAIDDSYLILARSNSIIITNIDPDGFTVHPTVNVIVDDCHALHCCITDLRSRYDDISPNSTLLVVNRAGNTPLLYHIGTSLENHMLVVTA